MEYSILKLGVDPELLNPHFDGYKLRLVETSAETSAVRVYPLLSSSVEPLKLPANTHLLFDEMYFRVHFNHLFAGPTENTMLYVDSAYRINMLKVEAGGNQGPQTMAIFEMPRPAADSEHHALVGYPCVFSLDQTTILAFDGHVTAYVLRQQRANNDNTGDISVDRWVAVAGFEIGPGATVAGPADNVDRRKLYSIAGATIVNHADRSEIRLHYCHRIDRQLKKPSAEEAAAKARQQPTYCIQAIKVDIPINSAITNMPGSRVSMLEPSVVHTLHSHAIPQYCEYTDDNRFVLGVRNGIVLDETQSADSETPFPPIPKGRLDPYYWMQTASDVTLCIQLPISIGAQQISCTLKRISLTLQFTEAPECQNKYSFNNTAFFSDIAAEESVWTLENGRLLTLYLEKARAGVRWPTVFSSDDGVLETMDPSEFAVIRDQMAKYTSDSLAAGGRMALHSAADAIDQDEEDLDQTDSSIEFSARSWCSGQAEAIGAAGSPDWLCCSFPEPACRREKSRKNTDAWVQLLRPVCLKFDVDGIVFGFGRAMDNAVEACHVGSFAALSYIQASKRERRFMYVDAEMTVAVLAETQRRIYIYRQTRHRHAAEAVQNIVDLGNGELLGLLKVGGYLAVLREHTLCLVDLDLC
ncbi:hypothetical protein J3B02_000588 [Coemansia erecta]|uniref:NudC domain-containing protein 1 n=1 Tax=Coemansia asiatica TaxID=1052880 RepID=A0A9W8CIE7_9FUNG|nr:hypothetical protein LPJ64_003842 [Coemansia asiatica]KAJ2858010.1 hypothetical protein J3B02_000588 [Coemansia erecta]KAJ2885444.1 hypothetical protein FB639_001768 [Coemansia asiatica]